MIEDLAEEGGQWTWRAAVERAQQRLEERGLVRFSKPRTAYEELDDIEELESFNEVKIAGLLARYTAWYSYATVELAYARAAYTGLDEIYDVVMGQEMLTVSRTQDGKVVKDILKGVAVQNSPVLKRYHLKRVELQQDVTLLEGFVKGSELRCKLLESELIRRAAARKIESAVR